MSITQVYILHRLISFPSGECLIRSLDIVQLTVGLLLSPSCALYGLLLFYGLTKDELTGRRPLAKFLCIKLIVMFTWYQGFVVRPPLTFPKIQNSIIRLTASIS
jgi:Organic solute transporter Ostalpha